MALKPWYKLIDPREDLRNGRPIDAAEFAVNLGKVVSGDAPPEYRDPELFFARTHLTQNLRTLAVETLRRLSGVTVETSAVFNLATQFGGGKTHALTLLWHLARAGAQARDWRGVDRLLEVAGLKGPPVARVGVFVGTDFASLNGRGGDDGTPRRFTPWGDLAWQLGGAEGFAVLAEHDARRVAPGGDEIAAMLPKDEPVLVLIDELLNYASRFRAQGVANQLYHFLQNLTEVARSRTNMVLVVSVPASELEMTPDDHADYDRIKKMLDRIGKAMVMSSEGEAAEIIRRRLFDWQGLPKEAREAADAYASWVEENRASLPQWFSPDLARDHFLATWPLHPSVLSVFERKWQTLPRFQQTRGVLRLLALWISRLHPESYQKNLRDPLITLGTAPLDDSNFKRALFEQLGEDKLDGAVITDIAGKAESHAARLDAALPREKSRAKPHSRVATVILFESNGGQQRAEATLPEIRLAVGEPGMTPGEIDTAVDALADAAYYLSVERKAYRFGLRPNLNKLLADKRGNVKETDLDVRVRDVVRGIFAPRGARTPFQLVFFPDQSIAVPDQPRLTLAVLAPELGMDAAEILQRVSRLTREHGAAGRTYKSALLWAIPENTAALFDEARKLLAWEAIRDDAREHPERFEWDNSQKEQLSRGVQGAERSLNEAVWRCYHRVAYLVDEGSLKVEELGFMHSSSAASLPEYLLSYLRTRDVIATSVAPAFLLRNWPPALPAWTTRGVRDAFFASPAFPRVESVDIIKAMIAKGVQEGTFAIGQGQPGEVELRTRVAIGDVDLSPDTFLVRPVDIAAYSPKTPEPEPVQTVLVTPVVGQVVQRIPDAARSTGLEPSTEGGAAEDTVEPSDTTDNSGNVNQGVTGLHWEGDVPWRKWQGFYLKVLTKLVAGEGGDALKISVTVDASPAGGLSHAKVEEIRAGLKELGLGTDISED